MPFALLPALDVAAGQALRRPMSGDASATTSASPLQAALDWQRLGAQRLHLVDLDAAFGRGSNAGLLAEVVAQLDIPVQLAGGIRDEPSLAAALATGCDRVVLGTSALADPRWCAAALNRYGDRLVMGLDVRGERLSARGTAYVGSSVFDALPALDAAGSRRYVVTDVARDGTLDGPNLDLLRAVCDRTDRPVLASGGVGSLDDLRALAALTGSGVEGAIVGKALLTGAFTLEEGIAASRGG